MQSIDAVSRGAETVDTPRPAAPADERQARRQRQLRHYELLKRQGEPFFPYSVAKDAAVSLVIFLALVGLTVFAGVPMEAEADPTNSAYIPRPEWYFMFLFESFKYFPGQLEWVGVGVLPALALGFLFLLPLLDRSSERLPARRPFALAATGLAVGLIALLTYQAYQSTPPAAAAEPLTRVQAAGKRLYQANNCAVCHAIGSTGGTAGPDLSTVAARRDAAWLHQFIEKPTALDAGATMPGFLPPLSHEQVEQMVEYLLTLK